MKQLVLHLILLALPCVLAAQHKPADTVEVNLAKTSKITFTMQDPADLPALDEYDYDALFRDILSQLENKYPSLIEKDITLSVDEDGDDDRYEVEDEEEEDAMEHTDDEDDWDDDEYYPSSRTYPVIIDFGINNYLAPDDSGSGEDALYAVRPWGSWYVGWGAMHRVRFTRHFSLEGKLGLSVYNFKFEEDNVRLSKTDAGTVFEPDTRQLEFTKSKLLVSHLNFSLVPVYNLINFTESPYNDHRHYGYRSDFRIGLGPYVGYRLQSYNKLQYEEDDNDKENERHRSNFHLNNIRYGLRLQIGVRHADFFFQYDMSELFKDDKGPRLNAYSFGISF